jgi:cobalt-zinc-cadmium efflux system protein
MALRIMTNNGLDHKNPCGTCATHHHVDPGNTSGSRLLIALALNLIIPAAQVIGGLYSGSVAIISDAAHNFSDFSALLVAYFAFLLGRKGVSPRNTFGYQRTEVLAACFNIVILSGTAGFIIYEALQRLYHPEAVSGEVVMLIAGIGVLGNGFSALLLHRDSQHSLNTRGAFLHMLGDLLTSVVVLISGLILAFRPWYWLDPLLSLVIVLFIVKNCWTILKESACILMNATPNGLDISGIKGFLEQIPGISGIHFIHAWNISPSSVAFSCHVVVPDQRLSEVDALSEKVRHLLLHHFEIDHPILQFETSPCGGAGMLCELVGKGIQGPTG